MAFLLKQFEGSTVSPKDDAIMYDQMSSDYGIIKGCELAKISTNIVSIASGYMLIHGRLIEVVGENINCKLPSGNGTGRIYVQMDLQNTIEPVKLLTVATTGTLPALSQDANVNFNNSVFEMELATYTATATSIDTLTNTVPSVKADFVKKTEIVNNLTSANIDRPLSANMGKTLNTSVSSLNTSVTTLNKNVSNINLYVGTDKKLHFVNKDGADSALPFKRGFEYLTTLSDTSTTFPYGVDIPPIDISKLRSDYASLTKDNFIVIPTVIKWMAETTFSGTKSFSPTWTYTPSTGKLQVNASFYPGSGNVYTNRVWFTSMDIYINV